MVIDFCFQGWVRGAEIDRVTVVATGERLLMSNVSDENMVANLESGEWTITLGDYLYSNKAAKIETYDFAEHKT